MKTFFTTLFATTILTLCFADEGWTNLFDEVTHEDFYFDFIEDVKAEELFEFKENSGLLVKGADKPLAYIQTLDEYSNYELTFEWRWPDKNSTGKSGVLIHSSSSPYTGIWPESIEAQIENENVGDFWLLGHKLVTTEEQRSSKSSERNRHKKLEDEEAKAGEWNAMHIIAKDDWVKVYLNDELVNKGNQASVTSGFITVQAEGSDIEYRNFRIRELEEDDYIYEEDDLE